MAAASADSLRDRFQTALLERNYAARCHALAALGREIKSQSLPPPDLEASLEAIGGAGEQAAFVELARLIVAKAAGCAAFAERLLHHPSKAVRFQAARGGLLSKADAREAFLSQASSRSLKKLLLECEALPSEEAVVEHAWELFGATDKDLMWKVLARVEDEELLRARLTGSSEMGMWLSEKTCSPPFLPRLAKLFPCLVVDLVKEGTLNWAWYWTKDILQTHPELVLRAVLVDGHDDGMGPMEGYRPDKRRQPLDETLASWGWRHKPSLMMEMCREVVNSGASIYKMVDWLMEVTSTRYYLTTIQKIAYLSNIWSQLPVIEKTPEAAICFVSRLPEGIKAHRTEALRKLVEAFSTIVADVGRSARRVLFVGEEAQPECTVVLRSFAKKLPPTLAVDQFFLILDEFDVASPAYKFFQRDVCKMEDGRYDELIQRVFERYLQKDGLDAVQAATMFLVLLEDARSRDVIQTSFDSLARRLGGKMDLDILRTVVHRMYKLEREAAGKMADKTPKASLQVPIQWVRFIDLPSAVAPHVDFVFHVLHTGTGATELLGAMLDKYGSCFFWDALGVVLEAVDICPGKRKSLLEMQLPTPSLDVLRRVDLTTLASPVFEHRGCTQAPLVDVVSVYFASLEETKRKTLGKDPSQRLAGYVELMTLANKDVDSSKAFADLLPFLLGRFGAEQDFVRIDMLDKLFVKTSSDTHNILEKEESLPHLRGFWKACNKTRESANYAGIWQKVGTILVEKALCDWTDSLEPNEACQFGMEVAGKLDLAKMFVKIHVELARRNEEAKLISNAAACWVFKTAVQLSSETGIPLNWFWTTLETLSKIVPRGKGAERALWDRWPFVGERWRELLSEGVKQKGVDFAFVGVVEMLVKKKKVFAYEVSKEERVTSWWAPLDCAEYKDAIGNILKSIASGEIPAKEASSLLARRVQALLQKEAATHEEEKTQKASNIWKVWGKRRRPRVETMDESHVNLQVQEWVNEESWDIPKHKCYTPVPWQAYRCRDSIATIEIDALSNLLASGRAQRQVLWQVVQVASAFSGPSVSRLVGEAIARLDPRLEGMARCIARHYPYVNAALTRQENKDGSCDVLTPLLELWLFDDNTRDACVGQVMARADAEYFLFYGTSFAKHLSHVRQEGLHACLEKLKVPGQGAYEFYHYPRRGPLLRQVAQLGTASPGWRKTLAAEKGEWELPAPPPKPKGKGKGKKGKPESKGNKGKEPEEEAAVVSGPGSVQMYLWHPDTQTEFLQKALTSTDKASLALVPRLNFADCLGHVKNVLDSCPKQPTVKAAATDMWGWEVIQDAGAYNDLNIEVERRFLELPAPWLSDGVDDPEMETILWALGRADMATSSLKLLEPFAGKFRHVKESVTKLISQVSPQSARSLIKTVMLPRKSGVGLQTAGLQMLVKLQVPDPLELYKAAWSNGKCPRDVAAIILAKVNTSQSFPPEDVREFFGFFREMADQQDECIYVAGLLLDQLVASPEWSLPFLPEVVAELAMLPGMTKKAVDALKSCKSHVAEVIGALTKVLRAARLAGRAKIETRQEGPEAQVLTDLAATTDFSSLRDLARCVSYMRLETCEPEVLLGFVDEVQRRWQDATSARDPNASSLLTGILLVWAKLLRPGETEAWAEALSKMESRLARRGSLMDLGAMANAVADSCCASRLLGDERDRMLATVREFFEHLLDEHLVVRAESGQETDTSFEKHRKECVKISNEILVTHWVKLLRSGCPEAESSRLFARCPDSYRVQLATALIKEALKDCKSKQAEAAKWRQKRPDEGWRHDGGLLVEDIQVGARVDGTVTNSSATFGVFLNFGCVKDGRLIVPTNDWKKYRVGDAVRGMIVNKVDIKEQNQFIELILMTDQGGGAEGQLQGWDVACRAVKWLSSPMESRRLHFDTLAKLWSSIVSLDMGGLSFEASLALLGSPPPPPGDCMRLVKELLDQNPSKSLARQALTWLGGVSPDDAVQMWPFLLMSRDDESVEAADVEALLALCDSEGLEPPEIPALVARGLSDEVLAMLAASKLAEARLVVIQALSERHSNSGDPPPLLEQLRADPCEVVAVAARRLLASLFDKEKLPKQDMQCEEKGKGKGKGKFSDDGDESVDIFSEDSSHIPEQSLGREMSSEQAAAEW